MLSGKCRPFCLSLNVLMRISVQNVSFSWSLVMTFVVSHGLCLCFNLPKTIMQLFHVIGTVLFQKITKPIYKENNKSQTQHRDYMII